MANPENKQIPYESTQKDIRDAIESVATAIGGIAVPSADHVSYDNSVSGLSATDVQNALDEIVSDIPTVNNGTLTIQQNGTSKGSFTANSASNVNVNIETPTADKKTATDQFTTADGGLLSKCQINLVPVQSGSGDPYPAGGGKNKFDGTSVIQANIQSNGTVGNVSANNRVIYCKCSPSTTYTISKTVGTAFRVACYSSEPTNGSTSIGTVTTDNTASSITITTDASATYIGAWVWNSADSLTADQMLATCQIELGNQATPYAPYSNVRPISGHTEVKLRDDGKNLAEYDNENNPNRDAFNYSSDTAESLIATRLNAGGAFIVQFCAYVIAGKTYTFSFGKYAIDGTVQSTANVYIYSDRLWGTVINGNFNVSKTGTKWVSTYTGEVVFGIFNNSSAGTQIELEKFQLEEGQSATPYVPYNGYQVTVQIGSTVYAGTLDVVSGVMTVTHGYIEYDGSEDEDIPTVEASLSRMFIVCPDDSITNTDTQKLCGLISNRFKEVINSQTYNGTVGFHLRGTGVHQFVFSLGHDSGLNTPQKWRTWLSNNPTQVVYPLANPFTVTLTPQQIEALVGQNNLSTPLSGQSIETNGVEYKELFTFADVKEYVKPLIPYSNAGSHNAIYRGKYLGNHVTPEQWASIVAGTFDDLFIGDYWIINSVTWRIAHFNYWLGTGDTECTTPHVVIVPDTNLYTAKMNSTDTTSGGYYNSEMRGGANYLVSGSSNLYSASETIKSAFGSSHILIHRERLTNAVSSGNASGSAWYDSSVDLMSEAMVYGVLAWSVGGKGYEVGDGKGQFALFVHDISRVTNHANWWLRGVSSATDFVHDGYNGVVSINPASYSLGVRPCFAIK